MDSIQCHSKHQSVFDRLRATNPDLAAKMDHMRLELSPLVRLDTGAVHPSFPATMLQYWLLTEAQCDDLAGFYHQRGPGPWKFYYPCPISYRADAGLDEKRRKIGKFIGLQGCDTPSRAFVLQSEEEIALNAKIVAQVEVEEEVVKRKWW